MTTTARMAAFGAVVTLVASMVAGACESSGSGNTCFPPEHGPSDTSCADFTVGLSCPVSLSPFYTCVCTTVASDDAGSGDAGSSGSGQEWVCSPADTGGGGSGSGGMGGMGGMGSGGTTGDASAE